MKRRNFLPLLALGVVGCGTTATATPTPASTPTAASLTQIQNIYNDIHRSLTRLEAITPRDQTDVRARIATKEKVDALNDEIESIKTALNEQQDRMYRSSRFDPRKPEPVHPSHKRAFDLLYSAIDETLSALRTLISAYTGGRGNPIAIARERIAQAHDYLKQALESI